MATQSRLPAFLLTRPMVQSARFAANLRQRFGAELTIITSPLISPRFMAPAFSSESLTALIFTSETGVEAFSNHYTRPATLPTRAYCVGNRTAKAAELAGLDPISADGDATALLALIQHDKPSGPLLHICGAQTRGDVAQRLTDAGCITTALVMYEQIEQPLTAQAIQLLSGERAVVVPLFSPRTSALFLMQIAGASPKAPLICAALSDAVAEPLAQRGGLTVCIAAKPTANAMIDAMARYFDATQVT